MLSTGTASNSAPHMAAAFLPLAANLLGGLIGGGGRQHQPAVPHAPIQPGATLSTQTVSVNIRANPTFSANPNFSAVSHSAADNTNSSRSENTQTLDQTQNQSHDQVQTQTNVQNLQPQPQQAVQSTPTSPAPLPIPIPTQPTSQASNGALSPQVTFGAAEHTFLEDLLCQMVERLTPVGTIVGYAGDAAPDGWLLCDGGVLDPVANPKYRALHQLVQSRYDPNAGPGEPGAVRLPDLRDRIPVGCGTSFRLVLRFGEAPDNMTLTEAHMPVHRHRVEGTTSSGNAMFYRTVQVAGQGSYANHQAGWNGCGPEFYTDRTDTGWANAAHTHNISLESGPAGGNQSFPIRQNSLAISYIIKY